MPKVERQGTKREDRIQPPSLAAAEEAAAVEKLRRAKEDSRQKHEMSKVS
jgi:hypothetical protein